MKADSLEIRREDITSSSASTLIAATNAELSAIYPEAGATHFRLDPEEVADGRGAFFVAYAAGRPTGCGAIRLLDEKTAEIKRMFVTRDARGKGVGRAVLNALENEAARLGVRRLVLETGIRQDAAIALYESSGYERIDPFGEYLVSPLSVCYGKPLRS